MATKTWWFRGDTVTLCLEIEDLQEWQKLMLSQIGFTSSHGNHFKKYADGTERGIRDCEFDMGVLAKHFTSNFTEVHYAYQPDDLSNWRKNNFMSQGVRQMQNCRNGGARVRG